MITPTSKTRPEGTKNSTPAAPAEKKASPMADAEVEAAPPTDARLSFWLWLVGFSLLVVATLWDVVVGLFIGR